MKIYLKREREWTGEKHKQREREREIKSETEALQTLDKENERKMRYGGTQTERW